MSIFRFLIVGAGPGGLYVSRFLNKHFGKRAALDLIDRDYLPGGLLRWGVAPDHPELRSSIAQFDSLFKAEEVNFYGGIDLQRGQPLGELIPGYSAVVLATGAGASKQQLLQNEQLVSNRIFNSMEFFHLYNGKFSEASEKFRGLTGCRKVAVIGNGNVTLDIARLLTRDSKSIHATPRIDSRFTNFLEQNPIESIQVVGRRGAVQAACAVKELRDLQAESQFKLRVLPDELNRGLTPGSLALCDDSVEISNRQNKKKLKIFEEMSKVNSQEGTRELIFRFLLEPVGIEIRDGKNYLRCAKVMLIDDPKRTKIEAIPGEFEEIEFDILIKNLGFQPQSPEVQTGDGEVPTYRVGWASSQGKGTIADLIVDAQKKSLQIHVDALEKKLREVDESRSFETFLRRARTTPELKAMFASGSVPDRVMEKNGYLNLREVEKEKGLEVTDPAIIRAYLSDI